MVTNNAANIKTGASGTILQGQGVGTALDFSTATYPSTAGTSGNVLTSNGTNWSSSAPVVTASASLGFYGDGSDSSQTFDGSTVILGITPSSNIYTLARDIYLDSSTINSGVFILTNGYRIFCNGTLTNNGTIYFNGNPGTNTGTAGALLSNTTSSINKSASSTISISTAGGAGNTGAGSNGTGGTIPGYGGIGGTGGTGGSGGGNGGTQTAGGPSGGSIRSLPTASFGFFVTSTGNTTIQGGTGGGGGGGDGASKGGGGGSGGGIIILCVHLFSGTGNIQAIGGAGGDGQVGGTNCGGGGGGGGGLIIIVSRSIVSGAISGQTISVAGGTPGNPTGSGIIGVMGNTGTTILLPN